MDDGPAGPPLSATLPAVATTRRYLGGLFIGSHAVSEGMLSKRQLERGPFRRILHNVYAEIGRPDDHQLKARAAALLMPPDGAIAGRSAAAWFGAPYAAATDPVLVVVPPGSPWRGPRGVQVHRSELRPDEVWTTDDDVRVTTAQRTAWEIATMEPTLTAVAFIDGMLHVGQECDDGLTGAALAAEILGRRGQWRSSRAGRVLTLVDGRAMSPPESRVRVACHLAGLPLPIPQFEVVEDGVFLGQVDLAWPEAKLIVEYEGAYHFDGLQIRKDDRRYERAGVVA